MNRMVSYLAASFLAVVLLALPASAQGGASFHACSPADTAKLGRETVKIWFRQSKIDYVPSLHDNQRNLENFTLKLDSIFTDKIHYRVRSIKFTGGASPEGSIGFNRWLSVKRAETLRNNLGGYVSFPDSLFTTVHLGRDWQGLEQRVMLDPDVPERDAVLKLLHEKTEPLEELKRMRAYSYLYHKHFPELRASSLVVEYEKYPSLPKARLSSKAEYTSNMQILPPPSPPSSRQEESLRHYYLTLRTNLLYDLVLAPNIGAEFWLGKNFSIGLDWKYAWMKSDRLHFYWRDYGGDINFKYWFGDLSRQKPFQGHHIGAYAQVLTYDFEFGGKGIMGGLPGGTILDDYRASSSQPITASAFLLLTNSISTSA